MENKERIVFLDYLLTHFAGFMGYVVFAHYSKVHIYWSKGKRLSIGAALTLIGAFIAIHSFYKLAQVGTYIPSTVTEMAYHQGDIIHSGKPLAHRIENFNERIYLYLL